MALRDCRSNQNTMSATFQNQLNVITFEGANLDFKIQMPHFNMMMFGPNSYNMTSQMKSLSLKTETPPNTVKKLGGSLTIDLSLPGPNADHKPKLIRGCYTDDLSLPKIHEAIRLLFASKLASIENMEREVVSHKLALQSQWITHIEAQKINDNIIFLRKEIEDIKTGKLWNEYVADCGKILIDYLPLASDTVKGIVTFGIDSEKVDFDTESLEKRLILINDYITKASKYIKMDIMREVGITSKCPNCGIIFEDIVVDEDMGLHTCTCGYDRVYLSKASTYKDNSRVNIGGKTSYEDKITFIRAMDKFEGKKVMKIPEKLYDMLDSYFESKRFPIGQVIKAWPNLPNGKKERTSVSLMIDALSDTKNAAYYDSIQYIASKYWGWVLPDLSSIREDILSDYDSTQLVYEEIKERESSLNVQLRMRYHYNARGCNFELSDFKILSSRDSLEYHHRMMKEMSKRTGVPFSEII